MTYDDYDDDGSGGVVVTMIMTMIKYASNLRFQISYHFLNSHLASNRFWVIKIDNQKGFCAWDYL